MTEHHPEYTILTRVSDLGRDRVLIRCPYCQAETWAYVWSWAGHGKKLCDCGATLLYKGGTRPPKNSEVEVK